MKMSLRVQIFLRSLFLQTAFGDKDRQALGFAWAIDPVLQQAYEDNPKGLAAARLRHLLPFNVQPHICGLPLGIISALELEAAKGGLIETQNVARISALKNSLCAALSGSADAFFWNSLRPLAAVLAITIGLVAAHGTHRGILFCALIVGVLVFNIPALGARWMSLSRGLLLGEESVLQLVRLPVRSWIRWMHLAAMALLIFDAIFALRLIASSWRAVTIGSFVISVLFSSRWRGPLPLVATSGLVGAVSSWWGWMP